MATDRMQPTILWRFASLTTFIVAIFQRIVAMECSL
jgi:hypothetical protein